MREDLHSERPNGNRCLPECGIGIRHAILCPVVHPSRAVDLRPAVEALHELTWAIVISGESDRGELAPPCAGDLLRRGLAVRAIALLDQVQHG